jgi:hypothetical protein
MANHRVQAALNGRLLRQRLVVGAINKNKKTHRPASRSSLASPPRLTPSDGNRRLLGSARRTLFLLLIFK